MKNLADQDQYDNLTLSPTASRSTQGLEVTPNRLNTNLNGETGKVTYKESLYLWDNSTSTRNLTDFYTHFVFVIDSPKNSTFGDGLTFFLAPNGSKSTPGGAMGLPIDPVTKNKTSPFVAVEFDTFGNVDSWDGWDPINVGRAPQVGIDVNSLTSNVTAVWKFNITNGTENEAWIRYDSSSHNVSVVFTSNNSKLNDTIHFTDDLGEYLPDWVTIGFSASTGTMGYLAPECVVTGKASKESDVYSFGIVALEIACGRKPLDSKVPEPQMRLVEWVWDLYGMGRLLEALDAKLDSDFDKQETERLMIVGLWCAHPDHNFRPKIREAFMCLILKPQGPLFHQNCPCYHFFLFH
ncbi:hypothetical protein RHMOL_Rhmol11G0215000 [Rhododendron molle]|uniref:Uncharacterized protein n=1 Tax=Rhododendron molle TaxID=49168 RepID=A0ACC0LWB0_RHOML|nr:hypothetical protein RHMOL_Rhmol11G0215000 [Rhododendron molle]